MSASSLRRLKFFLFCIVSIVALGNSAFGQLTDRTVDLRVLVISAGDATNDVGLDLIDDLLDELGVTYDVLDATQEMLTAEKLFNGTHGYYNGIILTNAELFGANGPSFTPAEWETLHAYERDFSIRESIISGFPGTNDYGMVNAVSGTQFSGTWLAPAGGTELFEYINTRNPLPINDFAFVATPRDDGTGPTVQPLLVDAGDTTRVLISQLTYPDGREVLLSTISNAWYLMHSQVLAYEFVNFATKGVFLGARRVYFDMHVDDLFLADALWDADSNVTDELNTFRMSGKDFKNIVKAQRKFRRKHAVAGDFKLDFAFNGKGAGTATAARTKKFRATRDTYLDSDDPDENMGRERFEEIGLELEDDEVEESRMLIFFNAKKSRKPLVSASLNLWTVGEDEGETIDAKVCRVTTRWHHRKATWLTPNKAAWQTAGGDFDPSSCVSFQTAHAAMVSIDVTDIVNDWYSGTAKNYGFIVIPTSEGEVKIASREYKKAKFRPTLETATGLKFADTLTAAAVKHKNAVRYINHTYSHKDMDISAGTTYDLATFEIAENRTVWDQLSLPDRENNDSTLVTGNHSGLLDDNGTELATFDDKTYPAGKNDAFLQAAADLGVRYLASDSSQANQDVAHFVPGFDVLLLPRRPNALFYNVTTPEELTDEYNYMFHERHLEAGLDPCTVVGAICTPRNYEEILAAEAGWSLRHLLTYKPWPYFLHQSNLRNYDNKGSTLVFDWMEAVISQYEKHIKLPTQSTAYYDIGRLTETRLDARNASIDAVLDIDTNSVTIKSDRDVELETTGLAGGEMYGGQRQHTLELRAGTPKTLRLDRALNK